MKTDNELQRPARSVRPAAEPDRVHAAPDGAAWASSLGASPAMAVQRRQMQAAFGPVAQRQSLEEEEPLQGRFATAQRVAEEDELQMKADPAAAPNRSGLPDGLKSGIESLSGMAMDDVKVHYGSSEPARLDALAYAQGSDIHLAAGQETHLPHEAWHVVQQRQGRVAPTMQMAGVDVNDDAGLEQEADAMGAKALSLAPAQRRSRG